MPIDLYTQRRLRAAASVFSGGFQSGQMGRTVNPLAYAFDGSNPSLPTFLLPLKLFALSGFFVHLHEVVRLAGSGRSVKKTGLGPFTPRIGCKGLRREDQNFIVYRQNHFFPPHSVF